MRLAGAKNVTANLQAIPSGESGTRHVLATMRRLVQEGKKSLPVRQAALSITSNIPPKNLAAEIKAIFEFVRDSIRYVRDIRDVETLTAPAQLLDIRAGDCDDKATLIAALLEAIGFRTRFVAIGKIAGRYSHVYTEVLFRNKWIPLETTENVSAGWSPPGFWNRIVIEN